MSDHTKPNNHKPALSFRIWDTGDETSMASPERLIQVIKLHQKQLANEMGEPISWHKACTGFLNETYASFQNTLREVEGELHQYDGFTVEPDAE